MLVEIISMNGEFTVDDVFIELADKIDVFIYSFVERFHCSRWKINH